MSTARDDDDDWGSGPASTPSSEASKNKGVGKKGDEQF
jgi:hypothetical protein